MKIRKNLINKQFNFTLTIISCIGLIGCNIGASPKPILQLSSFNLAIESLQLSDKTNRIIGGQLAFENEVDKAINLKITFVNNGIKNCTGVLLSKRVALTTASCVSDPKSNFKEAQIYLGLDKNNWIQSITGKKLILHPSFNTNQLVGPDIALIVLDTDVSINIDTKLVDDTGFNELRRDSLSKNQTLFGWGGNTTKLQKAIPSINSYRDCMPSSNQLSTFCNLFGDSVAPEIGDQGGPVYATGTLVGLYKIRRLMGNRYEMVNVFLGDYSNWIKEKLSTEGGGAGDPALPLKFERSSLEEWQSDGTIYQKRRIVSLIKIKNGLDRFELKLHHVAYPNSYILYSGEMHKASCSITGGCTGTVATDVFKDRKAHFVIYYIPANVLPRHDSISASIDICNYTLPSSQAQKYNEDRVIIMGCSYVQAWPGLFPWATFPTIINFDAVKNDKSYTYNTTVDF